jgi:GDP/UDP-N,N'-diacetylbacillosamine 2-epimerase (hydrolysing)
LALIFSLKKAIMARTPIKVSVVTGTRAEFGLLKPLLDLLYKRDEFCVSLHVTGSHLSPAHGMTVREIENAGFPISDRIDIHSDVSDSRCGTAKSTGIAVEKLSVSLATQSPDVVVILGDRFEILAAAVASTILGIPIAHIAGGETTEGAFDDAFRHAITKLSSLHFVTAEPYRRRVIQMGENPSRVINAGSLGIDNALNIPRLSRLQLEKDLGVSLNRPIYLVTFHPVTMQPGQSVEHFRQLLSVLELQRNHLLIFTKPNTDPEGLALIEELEKFCSKAPQDRLVFASLGVQRYFSLLQIADACVGNSSSGVAEAPALDVPTINVGDRQKGRLTAASVISCGPTKDEISHAFATLHSNEFKDRIKSEDNPLGNGQAAEKIIEYLATADYKTLRQGKSFFDIRSEGDH